MVETRGGVVQDRPQAVDLQQDRVGQIRGFVSRDSRFANVRADFVERAVDSAVFFSVASEEDVNLRIKDVRQKAKERPSFANFDEKAYGERMKDYYNAWLENPSPTTFKPLRVEGAVREARIELANSQPEKPKYLDQYDIFVATQDFKLADTLVREAVEKFS